jgi:enolase
MKITNIKGREVFDSRGNPTVEAEVTLDDSVTATAIAPSGASKGKKEALELRDNDPKRFNGLGVRNAVNKINSVIAQYFKGKYFNVQEHFDRALIELDGTINKSLLGGNTVLAVSTAFAKASAEQKKIPLFKYLHRSSIYQMPVPCMNVINGGTHAENNLDFEEFMIAPHNAQSFREAIRMGIETFHALKSLLKERGYSINVGDEGGFAPKLKSNEEALEFIMRAIQIAGFQPGHDISICIDAAASHMKKGDYYVFEKSTKNKLSSDQMVNMWERWVKDYPIVSIEDALGENDWTGWKNLTKRLGYKIELVGDDIFCTNKKILMEGIHSGIANSILIKPNQIGTITETLEAIGLAYTNSYNCFISQRSGETEDTFIADLAVSVNAGHLKTGSGCRGERTAKFNRLLRIEEMLGSAARFPGIKAFKSSIKKEAPLKAHFDAPVYDDNS